MKRGVLLRKYYKSSGKVSGLLMLYLPLTLLLFVPLVGFLHGIVLFYSPVTLLDLIATIICVFTIALLGGHWCVTKAKVRNKLIAWITALLTAFLFFAFSAVFFSLCRSSSWTLDDLLFLLQPLNLYDAMGTVIADGITISRGRTALLELRGPLLLTVLVLEAFVALVIIMLNYLILAGKPFDETRRQWIKEIELKFTHIDNPSALEDLLRYNDLSGLMELTALREVNTSYAAVNLFPMADCYYISVENYQEKGKSKSGTTQYARETLFEYLMITKEAGDLLLSKRIYRETDGTKAKIIDRQTRRRDALTLLRSVAVTGLFFFAAYKAYVTGQANAEMLMHPSAILITAGFTLYFILCMIGSYTKEDVIVLNDNNDWQPSDAATSPYNIQRQDSGLAYKLYYTLMSLASAGLLVFIITQFMR